MKKRHLVAVVAVAATAMVTTVQPAFSSVGIDGGGVVEGTFVYHHQGRLPACGASMIVDVSMRAHVSVGGPTPVYAGPLVISGTAKGCVSYLTEQLDPAVVASGTDSLGRVIDCPALGGIFVRQHAWLQGWLGGDCTVDGVLVEELWFGVQATYPGGIPAQWEPGFEAVAEALRPATVTGVLTVHDL